MRDDCPTRWVFARNTTRVDGDDNGLRTPTSAGPFDEPGIAYSSRIDSDFVGSCVQERLDITFASDASADCKRYEDLIGRCGHDIEQRAAAFMGSRYVEERKLVCTRLIVTTRGLHRVSGVAEPDKADAFDDAAVLHVKAGDDTLCEHSARITPNTREGQESCRG